MNVLIVCNNAYMPGNGLCTAVRTLRSELLKIGVNARVMASGNPVPGGEQPDYELGHFSFPVFEPIIYASGFRYAKIDRKMVREAIGWADIVHLEEAFPVEAIVARFARKAGKPCVGTYHLFSENIMANLGLRNARLLNSVVTWFWRKLVYDHCRIVQCPTQTVRDYLTRAGFKSELRVISNGIYIPDTPVKAKAALTDPYRISCIGRFANEKSQVTLLDAMRHSRYADRIQLEFAGKGPKEKKLKDISGRLFSKGILKYEPHFGFYGQEQLSDLAARSYLVIHCANVEVEGLSCIEALREGTVPVIAEDRLSATKVFALDERSLFPSGDSKALAERIDWWIEHPQERDSMAQAYADNARNYDIRKSIAAVVEMYKTVLGR